MIHTSSYVIYYHASNDECKEKRKLDPCIKDPFCGDNSLQLLNIIYESDHRTAFSLDVPA